MLKAAIIGAAGYTGAELTRLLAGHPDISLALVTSSTEAGRSVSDVYPALADCDLSYRKPDIDEVTGSVDLAFLAVPHTAAMGIAPGLLKAGVTVIDLSADFRLDDAEVYQRWYGVEHIAADLLDEAVYGLPELDRDGLSGTRLVACPGCYPTASLLAAVPALESGIGSGKVIVDAKSGVSGAGRTPTEITHYVEANESLAPYGVASHRHTPEIAMGLTNAVGHEVPLVFTPHLAPMTRGLLASVYLDAQDGLTTEAAHAVYADRFGGEPFITIHPPGGMPSTREVAGSNRAHLGVAVDATSGTLVVACAIDNLVKGAAGQAVQCANLVFGLAETAGLDTIGPVV